MYGWSEEQFQRFMCQLNSLDPYINFTCERSVQGFERGFSRQAEKILHFLDFNVIRYRDVDTNTLTNRLSIYRKECHSGSYIHSLSSQPISIKRSVIRNMYLRAYRYCDNLFLEREEKKIFDDFISLGYSKSFINKAKVSAMEGRNKELRIRAGLEEPKPARKKSPFHIVLPYHRSVYGIKNRLTSLGVDVTLSSRNSIKSHLAYKGKRKPIKGGVYLLKCKKTNCEKIYVGQSRNIPNRLNQHERAKTRPSTKYSVVAKHKGRGHDMDTSTEIVAYKSNSKA